MICKKEIEKILCSLTYESSGIISKTDKNSCNYLMINTNIEKSINQK